MAWSEPVRPDTSATGGAREFLRKPRPVGRAETTNDQSGVGPQSPSISASSVSSGWTSRTRERGIRERLLRDRLVGEPPRRRPGRSRGQATGPPPHPGLGDRTARAARATRRARRHSGRNGPGGDRDRPRATGLLLGRHRPRRRGHQPDGRGALPRADDGGPLEVRRNGRADAGQRATHRPARAPIVTQGQRARARSGGAGPSRTGRHLAASASRQPAALDPAGVLPGGGDGLPRQTQS
jgi:hypothetical protein